MERHYTRPEDVDLKHRFDLDNVMRTNEEWDIIHEAFRRKRDKNKLAHPHQRPRPKRRVHHGYLQSSDSDSLF